MRDAPHKPVDVVDLPGLSEAAPRKQAALLQEAVAVAQDDEALAADRVEAQRRLLAVLGWLWDAIAAPVLGHLGHTAEPEGENWPRLWWCPVGILSMLPVHAAGHHHAAGTSAAVMDLVVSSYTPTIRALIPPRERRTAPPCPGSIVVVAVPDAPWVKPLPGADAEANTLRQLIPSATILPAPGSRTDHDSVTAALTRHEIAHFACHGVVDWNEPDDHDVVIESGTPVPDTIALDSGGEVALVHNRDGSVAVWDLSSSAETVLPIPKGAADVALSSDGRSVVAAEHNHLLSIWDTRRADLLRAFPASPGTRALAVSSDGRRALSGGDSRELVLWDVDTGEVLQAWQAYSVKDVALAADGSKAMAGFDVLQITVWDTTGTDQSRTLSGHTGAVRCVALSADGRIGVSGSVDNTMILWDVEGGDFLRRFEAHTDTVEAVAMTSDAGVLASGSSDGTVILWNGAAGAELRRIRVHRGAVHGVALTPDGSTVVAASADHTVSLCPIDGGMPEVLMGHSAEVRTVDITPDGRYALSGDDSGVLLMWDLTTRQAVRRIDSPGGPVLRVACSVDDVGMFAMAAYSDDVLRQWRIHTDAELISWVHAKREVRPFTCAERASLGIEPLCDELGNPAPAVTLPRPSPRLAIPGNRLRERCPHDVPRSSISPSKPRSSTRYRQVSIASGGSWAGQEHQR